jgi:hypothetical protein
MSVNEAPKTALPVLPSPSLGALLAGLAFCTYGPVMAVAMIPPPSMRMSWMILPAIPGWWICVVAPHLAPAGGLILSLISTAGILTALAIALQPRPVFILPICCVLTAWSIFSTCMVQYAAGSA